MEFRLDMDASMSMIDLDASAKHGQLAGLKWSSAFSPPELASLIYEYNHCNGDEYHSTSWDLHYPHRQRALGWAQYLEELPKTRQVHASATFDAWSFGMVMYSLAANEGAMPFLVSATDNIVRPEELRRLSYEWEEHKLAEISKLVWPLAQDLVLWCLQTQPSRRPQSFGDVLKHPFFSPVSSLRFLSSPADTLAAATVRHAVQLHVAIEKDDPATVKALLHEGSVHYNLCLQSAGLTDAQRSITPVQRAARYGRLEILQILLDEIHPQALDAVINAKTQYEHTALLWACVYSHAAVVEELIQHGCNTAAVNHRGKTAWDIAEQLFLLDPAVAVHEPEVRQALQGFASDQSTGEVDYDEAIAEIIHGPTSAELRSGTISSWTVLRVFIRFASAAHSESPQHTELRREQARRAKRPDVTDTFRDDLEIDPA
eukprot:COSAG06_NODE_12841_length_1321_cov_19.211129_1_plen_429_part_10